MDGEIIPRGIVLDRAKRAVEANDVANPWAPGTAAGRAFIAEIHVQLALRQASERLHQTEQGA